MFTINNFAFDSIKKLDELKKYTNEDGLKIIEEIREME